MQIGTYSASGGRTEPARDHEARQAVSPSLRLGVSHTGRDSTSLGTLRGPRDFHWSKPIRECEEDA
jgi:hypothetical protein